MGFSSPQLRAKAALAALKGDEALAELSAEFDVHRSNYAMKAAATGQRQRAVQQE